MISEENSDADFDLGKQFSLEDPEHIHSSLDCPDQEPGKYSIEQALRTKAYYVWGKKSTSRTKR